MPVRAAVMPRYLKPPLAWLLALALSALAHAAPPDDQASTENQRRIDAMRQEQEQLLIKIRQKLASMPKADPAKLARDPEARAQEKLRQQLITKMELIEQRIQEQNARPRKRYLSPATVGALYADYYRGLRCKIEARGSANFPQVAGRKLYGELMMALLVNHDGSLLAAKVVLSSGDPLLDNLAADIAKSAAPFGPFSAAMRQDSDQIDITARFGFNNAATLEAAPQSSGCPP